MKCVVKMTHNSVSVGQGPPSPNKDEVNTKELKVNLIVIMFSANFPQGLTIPLSDAQWLTKCSECHLQGDGISPLVQTSVLVKGNKHRPPPIKLPSGSGSSSSGTSAKSSSSNVLNIKLEG